MKYNHYRLGIDITLEILNGKWKPSIICNLGNKDCRHDELMKLMPGISQKVLTQQLNSLIQEKIITKHDNHSFPRSVTYSLTDMGRTLRKVLIDMSVWGEKMADRLNSEGQSIHIKYRYPTGIYSL